VATMGTRNLVNLVGRRAGEAVAPALTPMNLTVIPSNVQPVASLRFDPPTVGVPIMREGFITGSDILPFRFPE